MPPDSPVPASPPPVPPSRPPREPVPGWMWMLFIFGPIVLGIVMAAAGSGFGPREMLSDAVGGAVCGLVCAVPFAAGLGLAGRFFRTPAGRIAGGLMFASLFLVGLAAVLFAGCLCILQQANTR